MRFLRQMRLLSFLITETWFPAAFRVRFPVFLSVTLIAFLGFAAHGQEIPTINWSNPADITYGTPLSATQLNATATNTLAQIVPGTFTSTITDGTVLNVGVGQVLTVDFLPDDQVTYSGVNGTAVMINVTKVTLTVTADDASA